MVSNMCDDRKDSQAPDINGDIGVLQVMVSTSAHGKVTGSYTYR